MNETGTRVRVDLSSFDNSWYHPGRSRPVQAVWFWVNAWMFKGSLCPFVGLKVFLLRLFGAKVGKSVVIKPGVNIKYPWNIAIGDHVWIGENAWLDSLGKIEIQSHACISQGAYLCTGNHDWHSPHFDLIVRPIVVEEAAWIGAKAIVLPGARVGKYSIVTAGSVLSQDAQPDQVYRGNPAQPLKSRWSRHELKR